VTGGSAGGSNGGGSAPPPPPPHKRQLDKIANGEQAISNAAGTGSATSGVTGQEVSIDGTLTGGAANVGQQISDSEVQTLESVGKSVPKV
jgi:hypothetical protein